jgi:hypothetical protein
MPNSPRGVGIDAKVDQLDGVSVAAFAGGRLKGIISAAVIVNVISSKVRIIHCCLIVYTRVVVLAI